jgi:hypothetical protein
MAASARAESPRSTVTMTADDNFATGNMPVDQNRWTAQPVHRSVQWDNNKSRWSLKLDMSQPVGRDMQLRDVQAGAYYRVTPSLRVGGAVTLGDGFTGQPSDGSAPVQAQSPRVRLETTFKF